MAIISIPEIIDIIIMTLAMGYIFQGYFKKPRNLDSYDPLVKRSKGFLNIDYENFKFAMLVTAPAIILHEFGHKFVAIAFGATAVFKAAYTFLILGIVMKFLNFGFLFFVPAYVTYSTVGITYFQSALIAFAGPFVNLVLWLGAKLILKKSNLKGWKKQALFLTSKVNMFLFIFNMLPIPMFDGFHFFKNLILTFF